MSVAASERRAGSRLALSTLLVFVAALAVHGVVQIQYQADPFASTYVADALSYDRWAQRIANHGVAAEPVFHQSPLFPLLLSRGYGGSTDARRAQWGLLLQTLLNSTSIALLVPLGQVYFGSTTAGVAAGLVALTHGPIVFYATKLLPVPLALATQVLGLLLLGLARRRGSVLLAWPAGAAWGCACLARSEMVLFLPLAAVVLVRSGSASEPPRSRRWAAAGAFLIAAAAVIAPVTAHNLRRGEPVILASSAGENLFIGNQIGARGGYTPLHPRAGDLLSQRAMARHVAEQAQGRSLGAAEISRYWRQRALAEIARDPVAWLGLEWRKLGRVLHPGDPTDIYSFALERSLYLTSLYVLPLTPWCLLWLAAAGAAMAWSERRKVLWPLVALIGVHVLVLLLFFVDSRLRLPLYFLLTPFAGFAVLESVRRWRKGASRVAIAVGALAAVLLTVVGTLTTRAQPRDVVRLASVLSTQQRLDEALAVLEPALTGSSPDPYALDQAGWILHQQGAWVAARERYLQALGGAMAPEREHQTRTRLAIVHERLGEFEAAAAQHDAAVGSGRADAGTYYERALFRRRRGDNLAARSDLQEAIRLDPSWPEPRRALRALGGSE